MLLTVFIFFLFIVLVDLEQICHFYITMNSKVMFCDSWTLGLLKEILITSLICSAAHNRRHEPEAGRSSASNARVHRPASVLLEKHISSEERR